MHAKLIRRPKSTTVCLSNYIYESVPESQEQRPPLTPEMVEGLPEELRDNLIEALESLEIDCINSAIQQVSTYDQALQTTLGHLASNFDYVTIMEALKRTGPCWHNGWTPG